MKTTLHDEVEAVERILELSRDPRKITEAFEITLHYIGSEDTQAFSFVDISHYLNYLTDMKNVKNEQERKEMQQLIDASRREILEDLRLAKEKLLYNEGA